MPKGKHRDLAERIEDLAVKIEDAKWRLERSEQRLKVMQQRYDQLLGDAKRAVAKAG